MRRLATLPLLAVLWAAPAAGAPRCDRAATVDIYQGCLAAHTNWGRRFPDRTVHSGRLEVTASTALAGAIASIRLRGRELLASGGHGSALQYAFHAHGLGECWNPTEAGSASDDRGGGPQLHGPSTSRIRSFARRGRTIFSSSRLAMYVPAGGRSAWDGCEPRYPPGFPYERGLSPYLLTKRVTVAPGVVRFDAALRVLAPERSPAFDAVLIAYLAPRLDRYWKLTPGGGPEPLALGALATNPAAGTSLAPVIAASADGSEAIGMWSAPTPRPSLRTYYLGFSSGEGAYPFRSHTVQTTWWGTNLSPGVYRYRSVYAVGTLREVRRRLATLGFPA